LHSSFAGRLDRGVILALTLVLGGPSFICVWRRLTDRQRRHARAGAHDRAFGDTGRSWTPPRDRSKRTGHPPESALL